MSTSRRLRRHRRDSPIPMVIAALHLHLKGQGPELLYGRPGIERPSRIAFLRHTRHGILAVSPSLSHPSEELSKGIATVDASTSQGGIPMRIPSSVGAMALIALLCTAVQSESIEVGQITGVVKKDKNVYSIGGDLEIMVQPYQTRMYKRPGFYDEIVAKKLVEKRRELRNVKATVTQETVFKEKITEGVKGYGFSLLGKAEDGQLLAMDYYWIGVGGSSVKVMVMGSGKTYQKNVKMLHEFIRSIRIK